MCFLLSCLDPNWQTQQTTWVLKSLSFQYHQPRAAHHSSPFSPTLPAFKMNFSKFSYPSSLFLYLLKIVLFLFKTRKGEPSKLPRTSAYQSHFFFFNICNLQLPCPQWLTLSQPTNVLKIPPHHRSILDPLWNSDNASIFFPCSSSIHFLSNYHVHDYKYQTDH